MSCSLLHSISSPTDQRHSPTKEKISKETNRKERYHKDALKRLLVDRRRLAQEEEARKAAGQPPEGQRITDSGKIADRAWCVVSVDKRVAGIDNRVKGWLVSIDDAGDSAQYIYLQSIIEILTRTPKRV